MEVLRVKVLVQFGESRVPTKCVLEELQQSVILKRETWKGLMVAGMFVLQ